MTESADHRRPTASLLMILIFWDHCQWLYRVPWTPAWSVDDICQLWLALHIGQVHRHTFLGADCQRAVL